MSENFGGGIYLKTNVDGGVDWDISVDNSGDIRLTSGEDELLKDIAFRTAIELEDLRGLPITSTNMNRIRSGVKNALLDEPRVGSILDLNVREVESIQDMVEVRTRVSTDDSERELVYTV